MSEEPDTYTPSEAGRLLKITSHRVRQLLNAGEMEGFQDERGHWRIPQRAVHALLDARPRRERGDSGASAGSAADEDREPIEGDVSLQILELQEQLRRAYREMGRMEGARELEAVTRSTLQEQLSREQARADRLEEELRRERGRSWWARLLGR